MSSRNLTRGNEGAVLLPLWWLGPIPIAEPLLLQGRRLDASAVADAGSKALVGLNNCLHCRHQVFKGQNSAGWESGVSCNLGLVYWPSSLGLSSWSDINAHCWKCSTWGLCGIEPKGACMGLKETVLRDVSCQCALFPVYLNSCGFPWVLSGRQVFPWSWSCAWAECQGATCTCLLPWAGGKHLVHLLRGASESARAMVGR